MVFGHERIYVDAQVSLSQLEYIYSTYLMATASKPAKKRKKKGSEGDRIKKGVIRRATSVDKVDAEAFESWAKYLRKRTRPSTVAELCGSDDSIQSPLQWCLSQSLIDELAAEDIVRSLVKTQRRSRKAAKSKKARFDEEVLEDWLDRLPSRDDEPAMALQLLWLCHELPGLSQLIEPKLWNRLLQELVACTRTETARPTTCPWTIQLTEIELPLTLAYLLPEIEFCLELLPDSIHRLAIHVRTLLDGEGLIHAEHFRLVLPLFASWTRCMNMITELGGANLPRAVSTEYRDLFRHLLRIQRVDGSLPFWEEQHGTAFENVHPALESAAKLVTEDSDKALAKHVLSGKNISDERLPKEPGYNSEWSCMAFLHPDWTPQNPRLAVDYSSHAVRMELNTAGTTVFSTSLAPEFRVNGTELFRNDDGWEAVCWYSDFDVDYLELCWRYAGGWTVHRQILMARQDLFLYIADNLTGTESADLDYQLQLPVRDNISLVQQTETREIMLKAKRPIANVLPIALPEWQSDPRGGSFDAKSSTIELRQWGAGTAMCAPLFIDLHPNRLKKPLTWRNLTIAQDLEILGRNDAVGYRVQAGPEQWLLYRSMATRGNRTVLGQNTTSEFLCGRFIHDGDVESIVEVE